MQKTAMPTNEKIDELAKQYIDSQAATEFARQCEAELRDQLISMIEQHGSVPRRATKSKRMEGTEYQVTLSKGHYVEVNSSRAFGFRIWCKSFGFLSLFRRLFKSEPIYVLREGAQELIAQRVAKLDAEGRGCGISLMARFHECISVKDSSPTLKVEPRKKEDRKEKEAAA